MKRMRKNSRNGTRELTSDKLIYPNVALSDNLLDITNKYNTHHIVK